MKKGVLFAIFTWFTLGIGLGQTYTGNKFFTEQSEVDAFGTLGYTHITGNLGFEGNNITSLTPLSSITSVGGSLSIWECGFLQSLNGLNQITEVGGELSIIHNNAILSLEGLNGIETVGTHIGITTCFNLTDISALQQLIVVNNELTISLNPDLTSYEGLENITHVGGMLKLEGNGNVISLDGLSSLKTAGAVVINSHAMISSLDGLDSLESIDGYLKIQGNPSLSDYCALDHLVGNNGLQDTILYYVVNNLYNPTYQNLSDDQCSTPNNVGISDDNLTNLLQITPNPTHGVLSLQFKEAVQGNIRVVNSLGQVVYKAKHISGNENTVQLDGPSGVYLVEFISDKVQKQFKVIKL